MHFALGNGQAIGMRADAACEHRVAVDMQMLRRDRGRNIGTAGIDKSNGIGGGDMFKHDFEFR